MTGYQDKRLETCDQGVQTNTLPADQMYAPLDAATNSASATPGNALAVPRNRNTTRSVQAVQLSRKRANSVIVGSRPQDLSPELLAQLSAHSSSKPLPAPSVQSSSSAGMPATSVVPADARAIGDARDIGPSAIEPAATASKKVVVTAVPQAHSVETSSGQQATAALAQDPSSSVATKPPAFTRASSLNLTVPPSTDANARTSLRKSGHTRTFSMPADAPSGGWAAVVDEDDSAPLKQVNTTVAIDTAATSSGNDAATLLQVQRSPTSESFPAASAATNQTLMIPMTKAGQSRSSRRSGYDSPLASSSARAPDASPSPIPSPSSRIPRPSIIGSIAQRAERRATKLAPGSSISEQLESPAVEGLYTLAVTDPKLPSAIPAAFRKVLGTVAVAAGPEEVYSGRASRGREEATNLDLSTSGLETLVTNIFARKCEANRYGMVTCRLIYVLRVFSSISINEPFI